LGGALVKLFILIISAVFAVFVCGGAKSGRSDEGTFNAEKYLAELPSAQFNLGQMYEYGMGIAQDYAQAARHYRNAADRGYASAQLYLGSLYELGKGVPQDYVLAHMWYNLAASQAEAGAVRARDRVALMMTPAQIAEAQKLAREWKPLVWKPSQ
jgi:TPR repeat protein